MQPHNLFINKKVWSEFSDDEMRSYQGDLFRYYQNEGFPFFPTDHKWRQKEYQKFLNYDYNRIIDHDTKTIGMSTHGLALCWSYHPHNYDVVCNNKMTVMEAFNDDETLKRVIAKRIQIGDNMSDNGLRKMLKMYSGVQGVSNFRPTASAAIYSIIGKPNARVYDMSAGWGGRMLGANRVDMYYVGKDPSTKTVAGLRDMIDEFDLYSSIVEEGSEVKSILADDSFDCAFTSPPYFDCEKYADEPTQSYQKFPTQNLWLYGYMRETLKETMRVVKKGGIIALNVQDVKSYPNLVEDIKCVCNEVGLTLVDEWKLRLGNIAKGGYKTEPILFFVEK